MKLTVLYDSTNEAARRVAAWLRNTARLVPLEVLHASSPEARERFVELVGDDLAPRGLRVVADDGRVWIGAKAWVMVLWALQKTRAFAQTLTTPERIALAEPVAKRLSTGEYSLGQALGWEVPDALRRPAPSGARKGHVVT